MEWLLIVVVMGKRLEQQNTVETLNGRDALKKEGRFFVFSWDRRNASFKSVDEINNWTIYGTKILYCDLLLLGIITIVKYIYIAQVGFIVLTKSWWVRSFRTFAAVLFRDELLERSDVFEQQQNQHYRVVVGFYRCNVYQQPQRCLWNYSHRSSASLILFRNVLPQLRQRAGTPEGQKPI